MLRPIPRGRIRTVAEFGPGTGPMTRNLLSLLPPDGRLFAFEISPRFTQYLRETIDDPRLVLVNDSAENIRRQLRRHGVEKVDAVVSSLGLTMMPQQVQNRIFDELMPCIHSETVLTQFQYMHGLVIRPKFNLEKLRRFSAERFLRHYFGSVTKQLVWRNLPPAVVYTCRR